MKLHDRGLGKGERGGGRDFIQPEILLQPCSRPVEIGNKAASITEVRISEKIDPIDIQDGCSRCDVGEGEAGLGRRDHDCGRVKRIGDFETYVVYRAIGFSQEK